MRIMKFGKKRGNNGNRIVGSITAADEYKVVVRLSGNVIPYQKGERIVVSIPQARKTALGKDVKVSEVVANGKITKITGDSLTIQSRQANPIISAATLRENVGKERIILVEKVE